MNAVSPVDNDKSEFPLQDGTVYGPIHSRRLGYSLGINPLPLTYKLCNFDCVYCQYGWTPEKGNGEKIKTVSEVLSEIHEGFKLHQTLGTRVDCLTIAGNGEPTVYPHFLEFTEGLRKLRDEFYPKAEIGILSDSSQIHRPEISKALGLLDERYMKLDAGSGELIQKINRPRGNFKFDRMVRELKQLKDIVIQSLFVQGSYDNTKQADVDDWIGLIKEIHPKEAQVYSIDRKPADQGLIKVSLEKLKEIASACQTATGVSSVVYG